MTRIITLLLALLVGYLGFEVFRFTSAGPGSAEEKIVFEIPAGRSFRQVAEDLQNKGVILSAFKMRVIARLTGLDAKVKRGEYALHRAMTPQEVLSVLISGKSIQYPITFPEGSNIFEMAALLESKGFFKADDFIKACKNKEIIRELLGVEVSSLEGYLFPETYQLTKFTTIKELLTSMVNNFKTVYSMVENQFPPQGQNRLARHELVTLASIVEKETGAPEERSMIASVFYNRLQKNMRLQSDPTIIYGIWDETGRYIKNITKEDIERPTRYNTYTVPRLPFGPIANPGREAFEAVMNPAQTDYLYFVSRNDGTHVFSRTYEDHLKAVRTFQLDPRARAGKSWRDLHQRKEASQR